MLRAVKTKKKVHGYADASYESTAAGISDQPAAFNVIAWTVEGTPGMPLGQNQECDSDENISPSSTSRMSQDLSHDSLPELEFAGENKEQPHKEQSKIVEAEVHISNLENLENVAQEIWKNSGLNPAIWESHGRAHSITLANMAGPLAASINVKNVFQASSQTRDSLPESVFSSENEEKLHQGQDKIVKAEVLISNSESAVANTEQAQLYPKKRKQRDGCRDKLTKMVMMLHQAEPIPRQALPLRRYELQSQRQNPSAHSLKKLALSDIILKLFHVSILRSPEWALSSLSTELANSQTSAFKLFKKFAGPFSGLVI